MNRADKMLAVLRDGRIHTRHDIWRAVGEFFLTNNAACELRARGLDVFYDKSEDTYRLCGSLDAAATAPTAVGPPDPLPGRVLAAASSEPSNPGEAHEASDDRSAPRDGGSLLLLFPENVSVNQQPLFAA